MEYVHSDLWGPARTPTHAGGRYFITFIDDYSRKVWVSILKSKDEAFDKFKTWYHLVENETGRKLRYLRTDNGLEYLSSKFNKFCEEKRIGRHRTVGHTPQQNGLAERMNRTLLERVRCMILNAGLPKSFWGEAVTTAAYLINRSPSSAIGFKTPQEIWQGKPAIYEELRVFGCLAYAHIKQDKLEARAERCIFIGYLIGVKGYKLWRLEGVGQKCFISRDVVFDETKMGNLISYSKPKESEF